MTTIHKSALVPYSAEQMYNLVDDIPAYPEFLPWCSGSKEITRREDEVEILHHPQSPGNKQGD